MKLRQNNIEKLRDGSFDVLIVGGGINGAVSAAALSAKGANVAVVDRGDFAGATSSSSSNLAWGGIKYLESWEFMLVEKLCRSRNHLMRSYPSSVREIRFLTAIQRGFRYPPFFVYLGTLLYWAMGRFFTQAPTYMSPTKLKSRETAINTDNVAGGFEYSDAYLFDNDARFVFNFIRSALSHGCSAANYVESISSQFIDNKWVTELNDHISGETFKLTSRAIINACGPYADHYNQTVGQTTDYKHLFSKGVHLIVDRVSEEERVITSFASDGRLFFVIPMGMKTCIGTTDTQVENPDTIVNDKERDFILANANTVLDLDKPLTQADIISERCGVRPLAVKNRHNGNGDTADWVKLSRKHQIEVNKEQRYLSVFGGKLTDCINVGEEISEIVESLGIELEKTQMWYGEPSESEKQEFFDKAKAINLEIHKAQPEFESLTARLWRRYGRDAVDLLEDIRADLGNASLLIGDAQYLRCELELTARREMITKLEDFLRRRSRIELVVPREQLADSPGLRVACDILFGDQAEEKLQEYLDSRSCHR